MQLNENVSEQWPNAKIFALVLLWCGDYSCEKDENKTCAILAEFDVLVDGAL